MPRVTKAQLEEAEAKLTVANEEIQTLEKLVDDLSDLLNEQHARQRQTDADLVTVAHEVDDLVAKFGEVAQEIESDKVKVEFYTSVLHTITKYAGNDVSVPRDIAYAAIFPLLVEVEITDE